MNRVILDASALLAMLNEEKGGDIVEKILPYSIMSTVNVAEVIAELNKKLNLDINTAKHMVETVVKEILPFSLEQAVEAATLKKHTTQFGLSLGDRACLSLAKERQYTVYTADKIWEKLQIGIKIELIR